MSRVVYKYPLLTAAGTQEVVLPVGAKIVHVGMQGERITLWAEVDPDEHRAAPWAVRILGTGDPAIPDRYTHAGTVFIGAFVFHVYVLPPRQES